MLNALNAISEDNSLLVMPPWINPWLILAIIGSIGSHMLILYVPFLSSIFGIAPLNFKEWVMVFAFSFPVLVVDEILKVFARMKNERELRSRLNNIHNKKDK